MRFERLAIAEAEGRVLGHNVTGEGGRRLLRKGRPLTAEDVATLAALGRRSVYVALLEEGDVAEEEAARRVAGAAVGAGLRRSRALHGRVNFFAEARGVVRVEVARLEALNALEGLALATLPAGSAVAEGKTVATLKVVPYAVPEVTVARAEALCADGPVLELARLEPRRVALVLSGSPAARGRIERGFRSALVPRLEALGAHLGPVTFVSLDEDDGEERLAAAIERLIEEEGAQLVVLAGETAIMDRHDVAPRAVERAGGEVACYGAPVDPGNLMLVAYRGAVPILGAPGCARSPKTNIVDLVLPRLLVGDRLSRADVARLGHGGLLEDVPERPQPRSRLG